MADPIYSLAWQRTLFEWEAKRLLDLGGSSNWPGMVDVLLREAFEDADVSRTFLKTTGADAGEWMQETVPDRARIWLSELVTDESRLRPYESPIYWAERQGQVLPPHCLPPVPFEPPPRQPAAAFGARLPNGGCWLRAWTCRTLH